MENVLESPEKTRRFMLNEIDEWKELTGKDTFSHSDRNHLFVVTDTTITLSHPVAGIVLFEGSRDGTTGDLTQEFIEYKRKEYPEMDDTTLRLRFHASVRWLAAHINFTFKALWQERMVLICEHGEVETTVGGKVVTMGYATKDCELSVFADYPMQLKVIVDGEKYILSQEWSESFVIYKPQPDGTNLRVTELALPRGHGARKFIQIPPDKVKT